jgi:beta-glucosidase
MNSFLWGVATSAYQLEGAPDNDWTEWERLGRLRARGSVCGQATGHWDRWRQDLALLPTIGANAYRFSVEWSRVEPSPGAWDEAALRRYCDLAEQLDREGIRSVVTLFHYTHPRWFHQEGGWERPGSVSRFAAFARRVGEALAGRVRIWSVVNEPIVFLLGGFLAGVIPPGRRSFRAAAAALRHLLEAHVAAAAVLREIDPAARVGIAHNMLDFAPERPEHLADRALAGAAERLYNSALLEAIASGRMDWGVPGEGRTSFSMPDLPRLNDFIGVNYYSRIHLRFRSVLGAILGRPGEFAYRDPAARGLTDTGWEIHPEGFDRALATAASSGRPILVTENGIATSDDRLRRDFLREHTAILHHRMRSGTPIEGYFHWSLLDNFEWLEGFRPRFGLFEVDYGTLARRRRPSADLFAELGRGFRTPLHAT